MIEGLQQLPWAWMEREDMRTDDNPNWRTQFDCAACVEQTPASQRARVQCGLLPRSQRSGSPWKPGASPQATTCVGYTTRLPQVIEAARALSWRDSGSIRDNYDSPLTPALRDAIDILATEKACADGHRLRGVKSNGPR